MKYLFAIFALILGFIEVPVRLALWVLIIWFGDDPPRYTAQEVLTPYLWTLAKHVVEPTV